MSSENLIDSSDIPNPKSKISVPSILTADDVCNNNCIISSMSLQKEKTGGVGDIPDLISNETPPSAVLELTSDSDLYSASTKTDSACSNEKGEGTEITTIMSPALVLPAEKVISSVEHDEMTPSANEDNLGNCSYDLTKPFDLLSQKISAFSQKNNMEKFSPVDDSIEATNFPEVYMLKVSDTHLEALDTSAASHEKEIDAFVDAVSKSVEKSGAVNAPEPEEQQSKKYYLNSASSNTETPLKQCLPETSSECASYNDQSFDASPAFKEVKPSLKEVEKDGSSENHEVSSQLQEQPVQQRKDYLFKSQKENDDSSSTSPADLKLKSKDPPPSSSSSSQNKRLQKGLPSSSTIKIKSYKNARKESGIKSRSQSRNLVPSPGRRQDSSKSGSRNSTKSPGRVAVVEVHQRKTPVGIKTKKGKYASPYQCKIVPIRDAPKNNEPFTVDPKTHRWLDNELVRALEGQKFRLIEAVSDYYKKLEGDQDVPVLSSYSHSSIDKNSASSADEYPIISRGSARETIMGWILKEKNKELEKEGIQFWNPMANIFRKTRSTQVSGQVSFMDKVAQEAGMNMDEKGKGLSLDHKIHLIGKEEEGDICKAAYNMYRSLKMLQKVIHLSDLVCFRDNLPELLTKEEESTAFYQPEFQKFMDSGNEFEVLQNVMDILGNSRDNIQQYLNSLQGANLVTGKESGLTKIMNSKSSHNNNIDISSESACASCTKQTTSNTEEDVDKIDENVENSELVEMNQIIPLTCPSCQSQIDVKINTNTLPRNQILPEVHTFLEEQRKLTMCTYYNTQLSRRTLIQTVMCEGLRCKIHFTTADPCGPIQGIIQAKTEYLGQPSPLSVDMLLSTIHRCTSYIETRIACSCVWTRQSKQHLLAVVEKYLFKQRRPNTNMNSWQIRVMEKKLKQFNVFGAIIRNFCNDLMEAVSKIQFCMKKSLVLLDRRLKDPVLPGFVGASNSSTSFTLDDMNNMLYTEGCSKYNRDNEEDKKTIKSVETLYENLKNGTYHEKSEAISDKLSTLNGFENEEYDVADDTISVEALMKIVALAVKDIGMVCKLGKENYSSIKMPSKNSRRVMRFVNATSNQLGYSKDIELGSLVATYLSAVEKLSIFDEFMCEQKVEIRSKVRKICLKIIKKLCELRDHLWMQKNWSKNLAKNSFMRIKELQEVKRLRSLKKKKEEIEDELELIRGSDDSLRLAMY